jgi:hypothetical protein
MLNYPDIKSAKQLSKIISQQIGREIVIIKSISALHCFWAQHNKLQHYIHDCPGNVLYGLHDNDINEIIINIKKISGGLPLIPCPS